MFDKTATSTTTEAAAAARRTTAIADWSKDSNAFRSSKRLPQMWYAQNITESNCYHNHDLFVSIQQTDFKFGKDVTHQPEYINVLHWTLSSGGTNSVHLQ